MVELVDVNEAREQMLKLLEHHLVMKNYAADNATQDCIEVLNELPIIDAQPVVHGHKVIHNRPYAAQYIYVGDDGYGNLVKRTDYSGARIEITPAILSNPIEYCSECGKRMDGIWQNYCDNCGAKMDEKVNE